jgi:hypothetical protein
MTALEFVANIEEGMEAPFFLSSASAMFTCSTYNILHTLAAIIDALAEDNGSIEH